jgi:hypothetical protein
MEPLRSSVVFELSTVLQPELELADSAFPGTFLLVSHLSREEDNDSPVQ